MSTLTFLGATGTVTGSKYLLEAGGERLMVDCGLFQGQKELRLRNWNPLPVPPASIQWLLLTHAHLDHLGYVPRLVKDGFRGRILTSAATVDLAKIVLPDSGHLQEEDAAFANKKGFSNTPRRCPFTLMKRPFSRSNTFTRRLPGSRWKFRRTSRCAAFLRDTSWARACSK